MLDSVIITQSTRVRGDTEQNGWCSMIIDRYLYPKRDKDPVSIESVGTQNVCQAVRRWGRESRGIPGATGNNLCSCLGEPAEGLGSCGNGLSELWQVPILGILGDAGHGLTQDLRNRGYWGSQVLSSVGQSSPCFVPIPALPSWVPGCTYL